MPRRPEASGGCPLKGGCGLPGRAAWSGNSVLPGPAGRISPARRNGGSPRTAPDTVRLPRLPVSGGKARPSASAWCGAAHGTIPPAGGRARGASGRAPTLPKGRPKRAVWLCRIRRWCGSAPPAVQWPRYRGADRARAGSAPHQK